MNHPEISPEAESLIQRMRREVEVRKGMLETRAATEVTLPHRGKKKEPLLKRAADALERVRKKHDAAKKWPNFLRSFRQNQPVINQGLLEAMQDIACEMQRFQKLLLAQEPRYEELSRRSADLVLGHEKHSQALAARVAFLENALHLMERRLASANEPVAAVEAKPGDSLSKDLEALRIDAFYLAFENQFRGSRELIKERLLHYVPWLEVLKERLPDATGVDIGCGRGEWLEVLKENGIAARGVDMNERMAAQCQSLGLDAECGDGIAYLRSLPADSQAIVSGFHIVEHLPFGLLLDLIQQAFRVLRPGGIAIFETPNPEAQRVSTYTFFLDPTHRNPIPNELLCFAATHAGFSQTHVERVQSVPKEGGGVVYLDYAGIFMK